MKRLKKSIIAAVAITLIGLVSSVGAMNLKTDGMGDALLFPVFNGFVDNYFTVSNNSTDWIQAHVRFRGAEWSAELRDFDIVLSPGDVFVFRLADLDGDGAWELDQSLDTENWTYTGLLQSNSILESSNALEPTAGIVSDAQLTHQRRAGYVEVIGEAVLVGLTKTVALAGVNAWTWSDAANGFLNDRGLTDVPNVLSGTAFISMPGNAYLGLAYNAEAIQDFRTTGGAHRLDTYAADTGVILHIDNSLATDGSYVYRFNDSDNFEQRISFNNTWGPTLADGDDLDGLINDTQDLRYNRVNSISEVEAAIVAGGQSFNAYYFDTDATKSNYFVHFPTKFFYGEDSLLYGQTSLQGYIDRSVATLMGLGVTLGVEVWDIFEHSGGINVASGNTSPATPGVVESLGLGQELNLFDIDFVKSPFNAGDVDGYTSGRTVLNISGALFPGLAYTFETGSLGIANWRSMQR
jgi:hypothetical protein